MPNTRKKRPSVNVGEFFNTPSGRCEVIEYNMWGDVVVRFQDGYTKRTQVQQLKAGNVKNPFYRSVAGVGFIGEGRHLPSIGRKNTAVYCTWSSIIRRAYCPRTQKRQPSYVGVSVDEKWHNFQNFADWYECNFIDGWHVDKDLLVKGNKVYSDLTCCFIPPEINSFLTGRQKLRGNYPIGVEASGKKYRGAFRDQGVMSSATFDTVEGAFLFYKERKERRAKNLAEKYRTTLSTDAYFALSNYIVEITD